MSGSFARAPAPPCLLDAGRPPAAAPGAEAPRATSYPPGAAPAGARSLRAARGALAAAPLREGAAALARWAEARAKELEVVAQRRDADGPATDRALEVVAAFIRERGLVLFGGLAIDYALRLKGGRLYPDDERPDFDFLSPRSVDDAYDLADRLHAAGFEAVGVIRAIHVQTMRVRTNFVYVADVGYAPPEVFAALPTVEYQGMRVIHPDYQRMDQLLAFCFPLNGPPREDVFHRWRKDLKRFRLYEEFYPFEAAGRGPGAPASGAGRAAAPRQNPEAPRVSARYAVPVAGAALSLTVALHGFAAYAALRGALDELAATFEAEATAARLAGAAPRLALEFPDAHSVAVDTPVGDAVHVASPMPAAAIAGLGEARWHDPYMDYSPEWVRVGPAAVLSTRGRLLAASVVAVRVGPGAEPAQARVVTPQYLLLHFLLAAHRSAGAERETYRAYYRHTLDILRAAEAIFAERGAGDPAARDSLLREFVLGPFGPTVCTLGAVNHDAAYVIKIASAAEKLRDSPPPALHLPPGVAGLLAGLPQAYYPGSGKPRPSFDYGANPLFRRSGHLRAGDSGDPGAGTDEGAGAGESAALPGELAAR